MLVTRTTMPPDEAMAHPSQIVGGMNAHHERVTDDRPSAVLLAVGALEQLEETITVLSDPATMRRFATAAGEFIGHRRDVNRT
jgi:PHD/YefM family antitoxin component YafN of YafNO toxin-antitoxin module